MKSDTNERLKYDIIVVHVYTFMKNMMMELNLWPGLSRFVKALRQSPIYSSTQNWTGYILVISFFWKSLKVEKYSQNSEKMRFSIPCKKVSILHFCNSYWALGEKPNIQFCRAKRALSIAIWPFFLKYKIRQKKIEIQWLLKKGHVLGVKCRCD